MKEQTGNLNQILLATMDTCAERTCFQVKPHRRYLNISYRRFQTLAFRLTNYFRRQGTSRVAIIAENCVEWMVAYVACLLSGGVVVPLRTSLAPDTLHFILRDSCASVAVLKDTKHMRAILASLASAAGNSLPDLRTILVVNHRGDQPPGVTSMSAVLAETNQPTPEEQEAIRFHAQSVAPQALASIFYVPSKTGRPKGVVFDHARSLAALRYIAEWFTFDEDDLAFTLRPWSEAPNLAATLYCFLSGIPNVLVESYEAVEETCSRQVRQ